MKKVITAIMIVLSIMISFVPFSLDVKADAGNTGYGTFIYGDYDWAYGTVGGELPALNINIGTTVLYMIIELHQVYSGNLVITASGVSNFASYGVVCDGGQINAISTATNQVQIQLFHAKHLELYWISTKAYTSTNWSFTISGSNMAEYGDELSTLREISLALPGINSSLSNIFNKLDSIEDALDLIAASVQPVYNLPLTSMQAWLFAKNTYDGIQYSVGDVYPYFYVTNGTSTRTINLPGNSDVQYLFYASKNFTNSGNYHVEANTSNYVVTLQQINDYRLSGYTLFSVVIHNKSSEAQSGKLVYSLMENNVAQTITLIPVYFGLPGAMPEEIYKMIYGQSMTEDYLSKILDWLNGYANASEDQVDDYDRTILDINIYLNSLFSLMPNLSDFNVDFSLIDSRNPTFDQFNSVSNFIDYCYTGITTAVPEISILVVLGLASMVLGILL